MSGYAEATEVFCDELAKDLCSKLNIPAIDVYVCDFSGTRISCNEGVYYQRTKTIFIDASESNRKKSVLLHELAHYVLDTEGKLINKKHVVHNAEFRKKCLEIHIMADCKCKWSTCSLFNKCSIK